MIVARLAVILVLPFLEPAVGLAATFVVVLVPENVAEEPPSGGFYCDRRCSITGWCFRLARLAVQWARLAVQNGLHGLLNIVVVIMQDLLQLLS